MKKCSSVVWRFFERIEENKRCVAVLCKLCETQYKFFGNTTNLRAHLINKHPIQWELSQNGTLDESHFRIEDDDTNQSSSPKRKKYTPRARKDQNVDILENTDSDIEQEGGQATINLVQQMHGAGNSDEEWLEEDPYQITHIETYEPKRKKMKYRKIKREVASPTGLPGFYVAPKAEKTVIYDDSHKKDEYSIFGEYVANKLRKFKTPRTRGNLQQLITTILWQAEYGLYDNADAVKRVLMYSIQASEPEPTLNVDMESQIQTVQVEAEEIIEHREDPIQSNEVDLGVMN
uniref:BED-type domain-containing protein n=1 Tax=Heliothis virescens TaxID=7102 RepID=A0A2A4JR82_HELVI